MTHSGVWFGRRQNAAGRSFRNFRRPRRRRSEAKSVSDAVFGLRQLRFTGRSKLEDCIAVRPAIVGEKVLIHQDGIEKASKIARVEPVGETHAGSVGATGSHGVVADKA